MGHSWALKPFEAFGANLQEFSLLHRCAQGGIQQGANVCHLNEVLDKAALVLGDEPKKRNAKYEAMLEAIAREEVGNGYPRLNSWAVIYLSSTLEAFVKEYLTKWIQRRPSTMKLQAVQKVKIGIADVRLMNNYEIARYIVTSLGSNQAQRPKSGVDRYEKMLEHFSLSGRVPRNVSKSIYELMRVRNALAHNNGVIDDQFIRECPWMNCKRGDTLKVKGESLDSYVNSIESYVMLIMWRAVNFFRSGAGDGDIARIFEEHGERYAI